MIASLKVFFCIMNDLDNERLLIARLSEIDSFFYNVIIVPKNSFSAVNLNFVCKKTSRIRQK